MIIKTVPGNFNKSVIFNIEGKSLELKFDALGSCNVKDDLGKLLLLKYKGLLRPEEEELKKKKTVEEEFTQEVAINLKKEVDRLNESIKNKQDEIEILNADIKVWKEKTQSIIEEKSNIESKYSESINQMELKLKKATIEIGLWKSSAEELKKICEDQGHKKSQYDKLVKKEDLISFILSNV